MKLALRRKGERSGVGEEVVDPTAAHRKSEEEEGNPRGRPVASASKEMEGQEGIERTEEDREEDRGKQIEARFEDAELEPTAEATLEAEEKVEDKGDWEEGADEGVESVEGPFEREVEQTVG